MGKRQESLNPFQGSNRIDNGSSLHLYEAIKSFLGPLELPYVILKDVSFSTFTKLGPLS